MKGNIEMKTSAFMTTPFHLLAALFFLIGTAFAAGETVTIDIGELPPGKSITISYDVTVNRNLPLDRISVAQQGTVSGSNFEDSLSDDPDTPEANDPTVTSIASMAPGAGFGTALELDGIDDHLEMADGGSLASTAHTIEAWVQLRTVRASAIIFRTDAALSAYSNALYVNSDGNFVHYLKDGSDRTVTGTTRAIDGRWYHVAGVVDDGGNMRLYVNGTEEGTAVTGVGEPWSGGDRYLTGHDFTTAGLDFFDGRIDEVRIWKVGLSSAQLTAWMYREIDVSHASYDNLAACYSLNETVGALATDSAGSVNGLLVNTAANPRVPSTIGDLTTDEDSPAVGRFVVSDHDGTSTDGLNLAANLSFEVVDSTLGSVGSVSGNAFSFTPSADANGDALITYRAYDGSGYSAPATVTVHIAPVADTPSVTPALTNVNQQSGSGLVISRNPADGDEVTHFRITGISAGTLYHNDGTTRINDGDFIAYAQGNAGLKFTPATGSSVSGAFTVQSSLSDSEAGLGGGTATATIMVNNPPDFVGAVTTMTVTQNSDAADFRDLLHVQDVDLGQTMTWTQHSAPAHGTLDFSGATAAGGGTDITPGGSIIYTPTPGYAGSDSFTVQVSDGFASAMRTITVSVAPIAPEATAASAISATGFTANWNAVPGAGGYYLDVASDTGFNSMVAGYGNKDVGNATSDDVTGLSPGTTYYYRVRAYVVAITGADSTTITSLTLPPPVTAAAASAISATGFTANWLPATGATGYYLDVAADAGFNSPVAGFGNKEVGNAASADVTGLSAGTTYYYRVRAYNGSGSGAESETIATPTVPGAANATSAAANSITTTGFNATWDGVAGADGYYLDVAADAGFNNLVSGYGNLDVGNVTTYGITGLSAGTIYYHRVRAYNGSGTGANSNTVATPTVPGATGATAATSITASGFTATWGSVAGADGYYLDVAADAGFNNLVSGYGNLDAGNATSQGVNGLSAGTIYYYRVRSYNGSGTGPDSNTVAVLTVPAASAAAAATSITADGFTANWESVTGADGYYLDVAVDSAFTSFVPGFNNLDAGNVTSHGVTGLSAGTTYYYRVRACNGSGTGANSVTIALSTIPGAAHAASATLITAEGFSVNWETVTGATTYKLDVASDSGFSSLVPGFGNLDVGNVTTYAVSGLSAGTTYYCRVRAANDSGSGAVSNTIVTRTIPGAATATAPGSITFTGLNANWEAVTGADGYYLDVAADIGFTSLVSGYGNLDVGNVTTYAVNGLTAATSYYYRVRAYNESGVGADSNAIEVLPRPTVSPSTTGHGIMEPSVPQPLFHNGTATFTILPDTGYHIDSMGGTCPGTLDGDTYTTSEITADCTVVATFAVNSYTVTGSAAGNGTISCTPSADYGAAATCTIAPDPGFRLAVLTANGNDITSDVLFDRVSIGPVTEDLSVTATFTAALYGGRAITSGSGAIGPYSAVPAADGTQHVVYERDGNLYYRSSLGLSGNWSTEETVAAGHDSSMALGNDGSPVIAFLAGGQIHTTTRSEGSWSSAAGTGVTGANSVELSVDGNGVLHLAYIVVGTDGYDDILYVNNKNGSFGSPETICDGTYASGTWIFCRTPLIKADHDGNYHMVYSKQQISSRLGSHDPQWMIYTSDLGSGITIASHDLNGGSGIGTPQLLARGSFGYDPDHGYSLVYGNDMEAAGFWLAEHLENGVWTEAATAIAGTLPVQGNDDTTQTRHMAFVTPDGRINHTSVTGNSYSTIMELSPKGVHPIVNPVKRNVLYLAADASGVEQLYQVGIDAFALITPTDGNFAAVVPGQTREIEFTLYNNGSKPLRTAQVRTDRPGYTFEIGTDACTGTSLAPGASCAFTVKNSHQSYPATVTDTLTVISDDPVRGTITLPLSLQVVEPHYPLEITVNGSGTVTATAPGQSDFTCPGGVCSREYDTSSTINLTAQAPAGYSFTGFTFTGDGSACCRESACSVTITGNTRITATFTRNSYVIATLVNGNGSLNCTSPVSHGDPGICTLTPDVGYRIEGVGGSCGGTLSGYSYTTLPMSGSCTVAAVFTTATQHSVSVTVAGTGAGAIHSTPTGISCNLGTCSSLFDDATVATLWAIPDADSTFGGWGGGCLNVTGPCELTLTEDKNVTADFVAAPKAMVGASGYATLSEAYGATAGGAVIKARSLTFMENLVLGGSRRVTLEGGFNAPYDCNSCGGDHTILKGTLTIQKGSVILENLTIR